MDKSHLLPILVHPKQANTGDYIFVWGQHGTAALDIVQVTQVTRNGKLRAAGSDQARSRSDFLPPTEHRKHQYLEGMRLAALPIVTAFTSTCPILKFPQETISSSPHVVGRSELAITAVTVSRSPSEYVDVRFGIQSQCTATVLLGEYEWDDDAGLDNDQTPFAYLGNVRFKVFQVEGAGKLYPGGISTHRAVVSNRAGMGFMQLFIPSGVLGGAIGTYTMLAFEVPPPSNATGGSELKSRSSG